MSPSKNIQADQVEIIYYTDPLCCWSWAVEPQLRKLLYQFMGSLTIRYCMGGLLPNWKSYYDELNDVSKPIQMGPVWMHAQQISGMPMDANMWMRDAPVSSYPACIALKCAQLQSPQAGEKYLRYLREAVMFEGKNISMQNVLTEIAEKLAVTAGSGFDLEQFKVDLINDAGLEAFREDLLEIQSKNIKRFPTLIFKGQKHKGIIMTGYIKYSTMVNGLKEINPEIAITNPIVEKDEYENFWGFLTERELQEIAFKDVIL